MYMPS
jgi:hypothetical protein